MSELKEGNMEAKDTLFHINWGDGDNCYCIAPDKATAIKRMPEGRGMVNYVVQLDHLYQLICKAGIKVGLARHEFQTCALPICINSY